MKIRELGEYIRHQRTGARLSLKAVSTVAGVSIPYLSQIERGLRRPSAEILQAIAKGLRISAETLYVKAGILEDHPMPDVVAAVMGDPALTERHKQALIEIYRAFREEAGRVASEPSLDAPVATRRSRATAGARPGRPKAAAKAAPRAKASGRRTGRSPGGRVESTAVRSPHPTSLRPPATPTRKEV